MDEDVQQGLLNYHVPHLWEKTAKGREIIPAGVGGGMRATSRFAKGRTIDTFVKGIAQGFKPRSLDIADLNTIEDLDTAHVLMSRRIAGDIVDQNLGRWSSSPVEGMTSVDAPGFTKTIAIEDARGSPMVVTQRLWVTPQTRQALSAFIGHDPFAEVGGLHALQTYQGLVKRGELSLSLFHDFHLVGMLAFTRPLEFAGGLIRGAGRAIGSAAGAVARGDIRGAGRAVAPAYEHLDTVRQGLDWLQNPTPTMERLIRGGLTTRTEPDDRCVSRRVESRETEFCQSVPAVPERSVVGSIVDRTQSV